MVRSVAFALALLSSVTIIDDARAENPAASLYYRGLAEVTATLPRSKLIMPSTAMPCINCHGADGRGGREGGVAVPPISWRHLAMATTERPAYDQALLARALRDGIGADGAPLHEIMPQYELSDGMATELSDWLQTMGSAHAAGVSKNAITVAIPSTKTDDPRAAVVARMLRLYADRLNRQGGIYGRNLHLIEGETEGSFAQLAAVEPGKPGKNASLDLWPLHAAIDGKPASLLIPSDGRLMRNLLAAARRVDPKAGRFFEIGDEDRPLPEAFVFEGEAAALSAFLQAWQGPTALTIFTTTDHIDLEALQNLPPRPLKLVLANPFAHGETSDNEATTSHLIDFWNATRELELHERMLPLAKAAWVAASMLEDALRATGRILDRERFKAALASMPLFDSGLLPPIHPTRGLTSIGLVTFDLPRNEIKRTALALD